MSSKYLNTSGLAGWLVFHCKPAPLLDNRLVWRQELILPSTFKCTGKYLKDSPLGAAGFYVFCWISPPVDPVLVEVWGVQCSVDLVAPQLRPKMDRGGWLETGAWRGHFQAKYSVCVADTQLRRYLIQHVSLCRLPRNRSTRNYNTLKFGVQKYLPNGKKDKFNLL